MTMNARMWRPGFALAGALMLGLAAGAATADEPPADPFAGLAALGQGDLALLNGRQGLVFQLGQQSFEIESSNQITADQITSGSVNLQNSFAGSRGFNAMANNTGNNAITTNGLIVNLNLH
jgi:hypothetical protein